MEKQLSRSRKNLRFLSNVVRDQPFHCLIQVTNRCNMKCSFCDFWSNGVPSHQELQLEDYQRLADQLADIGSFLVSIEGGEPTLRPDLARIIEVFSRQHIPVLFTNGWYIDERKADDYFNAGVSEVAVSIDFPDAERHDAKRGFDGAFDKAWQAVELLRDRAPRAGNQVHVISVVMRDNQHDLEALLQMSAQYKVGHHFTMISLDGYRRNHAEDNFPDQPISDRLHQLWKRYPHLKVFRNYLKRSDAFLSQQDLPRCQAGRQGFNLDHLGNVSPCIEKINASVGNIKDNSIVELLAHMQDLPDVRSCQDCWSLCRGFNQSLGSRSSVTDLFDLVTRMRV